MLKRFFFRINLDEVCDDGFSKLRKMSSRIKRVGIGCNGMDILIDSLANSLPTFPQTSSRTKIQLETFLNATCASVTCRKQQNCLPNTLSCRCCHVLTCFLRPKVAEDPDRHHWHVEDLALHDIGRLGGRLPFSVKKIPDQISLSKERSEDLLPGDGLPLLHPKTENARRRFQFGRYLYYNRSIGTGASQLKTEINKWLILIAILSKTFNIS